MFAMHASALAFTVFLMAVVNIYCTTQCKIPNYTGRIKKGCVLVLQKDARGCDEYSVQCAPVPTICLLPPDPGSCGAQELRYYYDDASSTCRGFTYSGCHGNANNFVSLQTCEKTCAERNMTIFSNRTIHVVKDCPANEDFHTCGSACEPTCAVQSPVCVETCIVDICQCTDGYARFPNGSCIPFAECPPVFIEVTPCGKNERFTNCGTACEPTCLNPEPTICTMECVVDVCQCEIGFVRNSKGRCVSKSECISDIQVNATCDFNEVFMKCGTACEPTCSEPFPAFCTDHCVPDVCQCSPGFVRDSDNGCILLIDCPAPDDVTCGHHERLQACGTACEPSCATPEPKDCTKQCILNVCQCRSGFVRHPNGQCVRKKQCPPVQRSGSCGKHEVMKTGPICEEASCSSPNPTNCRQNTWRTACQCETGYLRGKKDACVLPSQCAL